MNKFSKSCSILFSLAVLGACHGPGKNNASNSTSRLIQKTSMALPVVKGGFDLMALDRGKRRLFVSAEDNHTLEVLDLDKQRPVHSIPGLEEPKWVVYRPEKKALYVATGGDGKVTEFDDSSFSILHRFSFKEKCNNLRFDETTGLLWVGVGDSFGALGIIDTREDTIVGQIPLSDYPKQFELDGNRIYVNIPRKNRIEVANRVTRKIIATWPVMEAVENVPMGLDRTHQRLFVGCEPGKLVVFSTATGTSIASLDIDKEADGIYYDEHRRRLYISCGEGFLDVISQNDPDHYQLLEKIPTAKGAGTSLYSPELDELFLAVPQANGRQAAIRIYQPAD
ncbi:MAG TPA: YncE family protein [Puia sp.]|uniref:YncE family protein n=1 Tax=Puia sp. TaxID=2045100 RepID=UPI002CE4AD5D|nr:YncE family protein [Puia sp.]HVU93691.1 YncE family protein [Puia sp.]